MFVVVTIAVVINLGFYNKFSVFFSLCRRTYYFIIHTFYFDSS